MGDSEITAARNYAEVRAAFLKVSMHYRLPGNTLLCAE